MKLNVVVDERVLAVDVPADMLTEAQAFYRKMDADMDRGWQMGPEFIAHPDRVQRCQIAASRLLGSLSSANETMVLLMAGYILSRLPNVNGVRIDTGGEMLNTAFSYATDPVPAGVAATSAGSAPPARLGKREALARAGKEVSAVYGSGRGYRFATLDSPAGQWIESPLLDDEQQANEARMAAFRRRYEQLLAGSGLS